MFVLIEVCVEIRFMGSKPVGFDPIGRKRKTCDKKPFGDRGVQPQTINNGDP